MQKTITAVIVLILLIGVVALNGQLSKTIVKDHDDDEHPAAEQQKPAEKPAPAASKYVDNTATTGPVSEAVIGSGSAPTSVAIGYTWDATIQQNQDALKQIITDAENWGAAPGHHVQIVCVDIPSDQRQYPENALVGRGVAVNGKPVAGLTGNPGSQVSPAAVRELLAKLK